MPTYSLVCDMCGNRMTASDTDTVVVCNACLTQYKIKKSEQQSKEEQLLEKVFKEKYETKGMTRASFFANESLKKRELELYRQQQSAIINSINDMINQKTSKEIDSYEYFGIKRNTAKPAPPKPAPPVNTDFEIVDGKLVKIKGDTANHQTINVPLGVTSVGPVFKGLICSCVDLPRTLEKIDAMAFFGCNKIYKIDLKKGVKEIGTHAFANCTSLTDFYIPTSVEIVGKGAFNGLTKHQTIFVYRNQVKNWDKNWKKGCKALIELYD